MSKALRPILLLGLIASVGSICYAGTSNLFRVPEPGTLTLLLAGLGVMAVRKAIKRS